MKAAGRIALWCMLSGAAVELAAAERTALEALKLVAPEQAKNLTRIEGREGRPFPDRWRFIVHDPEAKAGVREIVVEGDSVVASRTLSQFAASAAPEDVIDPAAVSVDSSAVEKRLREHAAVNGMQLDHVSYSLSRDEAEGAPVWLVRGYDQAGGRLGELRIRAATGEIVARDGFAVTPTPTPVKAAVAVRATPKATRTATRRAEPARAPTPERPAERSFRSLGDSFGRLFRGRSDDRERRR